jgi:iron complex outermembrane receptor protein
MCYLSFRLLPLAMLALVFCPKTSHAQGKLPDSVALQTVLIQSTRASAKNPVPHSNLRASQIAQAAHAQDIPFLLTSVPSLVENSDAGTGIGYTGLRIRGSDPTRVNVTINGIPLNDAESQGVFWVNLPDLAASAAEIQVQRGVGTSTNGAGAFGATVNVDLSKVEAEPFALLGASVGAFGTRKQSAYLGSGLLQGRWAFSGRFSNIQSEGYVDRASADLRSMHLSGAYVGDRQVLQVHFLSGKERTYQAWYGLPAQFLGLDSLRRFNPAGTERSGGPYPDEVDDYTQRHHFLHYKKLISSTLDLQLNGHYTRGFGFFEQYKADEAPQAYGFANWGEGAPAETDLVRRRWLDNHFYGSTFTLRWAPRLPQRPIFLLGGAASRYTGRHFGEITWAEQAPAAGKDWVYYDNDAQKDDANLFLKLESSPTERLGAFVDLQLRGVRYAFLGFDNLLNNVTQQANLLFFNPKIGLNYALSEHCALTAFAGVAQREPNRDDYTQSSPQSRPRAERLLDLESGLRYEKQGWRFAANAYFMRYRDQLVLDGRINDVGAYIRSNVPDSYRAGLELEMTLPLAPRLALSGNACLSRNKVQRFTEFRDNWDDGTQAAIEHRNTDLAFSPGLTARLEANWLLLRRARQQMSLNLSGKHVGRQFLDNSSNPNTQLPAYRFADLRLNYDLERALGHQLRFIFSLNNLFNAQYAANGWAYRFISTGYDPRPDDPYTRSEGAGLYHQAGFFPQAGRHWMATLQLRW